MSLAFYDDDESTWEHDGFNAWIVPSESISWLYFKMLNQKVPRVLDKYFT